MVLSVLAMHDYDPSIFDIRNFRHPDSEFDNHETLINNILLNCAELTVIYSNPEVFKEAVLFWSCAHINEWDRLVATLELKYNIIDNTSRRIMETISTANTSSSDTREKGTSTSSSSGTNYVYGFNGTNEAEKDKTIVSETRQPNLQNVGEFSSNRTQQKETEMSGKVGVQSFQSIIEKERELDKFCLIDYIVDQFKQRFCVMVY